MKKNDSYWWISLYNTLYLLGVNKNNLQALETSTFDPLDELELSLDLGFCEDSLSFMVKNKWITIKDKKELEAFKKFADNIATWNYYEYENNSDWSLLKQWAEKLFFQLSMSNNDWVDYRMKTIYTSIDDQKT